jgi:hypothetical protein
MGARSQRSSENGRSESPEVAKAVTDAGNMGEASARLNMWKFELRMRWNGNEE